MKQRFSFLSLLLLFSFAAMAQTQVGSLYYTLNASAKRATVTKDPGGTKYTGSITIPASITVDGVDYSVTSIGAEAFKSCSGLTSVSLPEGLTSIGDNNFQYCNDLTSVSLPEGLTSVGQHSFSDSDGLTSLSLPASLTSVGQYSFYSCAGLHYIWMKSSKVPSTGAYAFQFNLSGMTIYVPVGASSTYKAKSPWSSLNIVEAERVAKFGTLEYELNTENRTAKVINFPDGKNYSGSLLVPAGITVDGVDYSVTSIGGYCFYEYSGLTKIFLPETLTSIGNNAFSHCSGLTDIKLPETLTSIGNYAFYYCSGLTDIKMSAGLTSIGNYAFYYCSGLTNIKFPAGLTSIGDYAFSDCTNLSYLVMRSSRPTTGSSVFADCTNLKTIYVPVGKSSNYKYSPWNSSSYTIVEGELLKSGGLYYVIDSAKKTASVTFSPDGTKYSGSITVPSSFSYEGKNYLVKAIGANAFASCRGLTSMYLPEGLTSIGSSAFSDCSGLKSISLPESLTSIGSKSFYQSGLTSVSIPEGVTSIADQVFYSSTKLESIELPSGLTSIGSNGIYNCGELKYIVMHSPTVPTTSTNVFGSCSKLKTIYVPVGASSAYKAKTPWNSSSYTIVEGELIKSGGLYYVIDGVNGTACVVASPDGTTYSGGSITVPSSFSYRGKSYRVTAIGNSAFYKCSSLTSISLPEGITSIGGSAFRDCSSLTSISLPESLTSIGGSAFYNCGLTSISIPEGVTSIGDYTFNGCPNLESIELPSGLTSIGNYGINSCYSLKSITMHSSVVPSTGTSVLSSCSQLKTIYVPVGASSAYKAKSPWSSYTIIEGELVKSGGLYYFLERVNKTASVTFAPDGTEYSGSVVVPASITVGSAEYSVTSIGDKAFKNCNNLTSISLPHSVTSIGANAFNGCTNVTSISLPNGVTSVGASVFKGCSNLTSISLPETLSSIGDDTFYGCSSLTGVVIPKNVTSIGGSAFADCSSLTSIKMQSATPPATGDYLFIYSTKLDTIYVPYGAAEAYNVEPWNAYNIIDGKISHIISVDGIYYNVDIETNTAEVIADPNGTKYSGDVVIPARILVDDKEVAVTSIENYAFSNCKDLTSLTMESATPPAAGDYVFDGCTGLTTIYVPSGAFNAYNVAPWNVYDIKEQTYALVDGAAYTRSVKTEGVRIAYNRNFPHLKWQAWYAPFDMDYDEVSDEYTMASINAVREYDDNEDGVLDRWSLEVLMLRAGETVYANMPYVIRPKQAGAKEFVMENATLYPADEETVDCSSTKMLYTFKGVYSAHSASELLANGWLAMGDGRLVNPTAGSTLNPFRWYMSTAPRGNYSSVYYAPKRVELVVIDEDGEVTDIEEMPLGEENAAMWPADVYDLNGRLVKAQAENLDGLKKGIYVVNGQKLVK